MNDIVKADDSAAATPVFSQRPALPASVNMGAVSIEAERAVAEARGQMQLAKMFPRNLNAAHAELMESCAIPAMASVAFYSVPRGNSKITGPSIRLAEEIARVFGNFEFGHRELSRGDGKSEVEVYAWDKETNNRSIRQITVRHVIDTQNGPKPCRDQGEIDNLIANKASKQLRGRILAMMPKWLVESAIEQCKLTISGGNKEPLSVRVRKMTGAFAPYGVTVEHIEKRIGKKLDDILLDELVDLIGVYNAIKEGEKASDFFGGTARAGDEPDAPVIPPAGQSAPANDNQPPAGHAAARSRKKADAPSAAAAEQQAPAAETAAAATEHQPAAKPAQPAAQAAAPAGDAPLF